MTDKHLDEVQLLLDKHHCVSYRFIAVFLNIKVDAAKRYEFLSAFFPALIYFDLLQFKFFMQAVDGFPSQIQAILCHNIIDWCNNGQPYQNCGSG